MFTLYIKEHSVTKVKYFGVTTKTNPFKYRGSGVYWRRHCEKHGWDHVRTIEVWGFDNIDDCSYFALKFSKEHEISRSILWANLTDENGKDGLASGVSGNHLVMAEKRRGKTYEELYGTTKATEIKANISKSLKGRYLGPKHDQVFKTYQSERMKSNNPMKNEDTKAKNQGIFRKGRTFIMSDSHRANISIARSPIIEYKGSTYRCWKAFKISTGVSKTLYQKYYLNGIDPEPYIGIFNHHVLSRIEPTYLYKEDL